MICINDRWGIESDQCNWILKKRVKSKEEYIWKTVGFYPTLEQLLLSYMEKKTKKVADEEISIQEVVGKLEELQNCIAKEIQSLGCISKPLCENNSPADTEQDFFE